MSSSSRLSIFLSFALLICLNSCRKKLDTLTVSELKEELSKTEKFNELRNYAQSIGIDPADKTQRNVFKLIEESVYGSKPDFRHIEKINKPDSSWLRAVAIKLLSEKSSTDALKSLQPTFPAYQELVVHYQRLIAESKTDSAKQVAAALNEYRWIWRQTRGTDRFVLVNINGAYLQGMDSSGKEVIQMRTIVGKTATPTPTIDTYATHVITHPYWNVPKSIATKEMLPKIQKDISYLASNGIEVINQKGEVVAPEDVDWNSLSKEKLPYRFRQDSGEDNSLGLLKVDIKNPLAIYLHDTNMRYLFTKEERWRSHGCVRVEHPTELANFIAGKKLLDNDFLTEPTDTLPPKWYKLDQKIPVFLVKLGADVNRKGQLTYYKNPYLR
jgi:murein L,D-transpeptidase YcbB/YkuD